MLTDELFPEVLGIDSFGDALLASLVMAAVSIVLQVDHRDQRRRRVHAAGDPAGRPPPGRADDQTDAPGHRSSSRSTASRCRSCAARCATAALPTWPAGSPRSGYQLTEWETDLSSQTGRQPGRDPARLERGHPGVPLGREGDGDADDPARRRPTAPRSSAARDRRSGCSPTAGRAAATCSRARPTRRSSPSAGSRPRSGPTPATGRSSPTASTSPGRWSCSSGR